MNFKTLIKEALLNKAKVKTGAGLAICALLVLLTSACGAKGSLYLPEKEEAKQQQNEQEEEQKKKKTETN